MFYIYVYIHIYIYISIYIHIYIYTISLYIDDGVVAVIGETVIRDCWTEWLDETVAFFAELQRYKSRRSSSAKELTNV